MITSEKGGDKKRPRLKLPTCLAVLVSMLWVRIILFTRVVEQCVKRIIDVMNKAVITVFLIEFFLFTLTKGWFFLLIIVLYMKDIRKSRRL